MDRMSWRQALSRLAVAAGVIIWAGSAMAAPTISVDISTVGGGYGYAIEQEGAPNPDGTFSLSGVAGGDSVPGAAFLCDWSILVNPDPQITSTLTLTNISGVTQTFIMNVTLGIAPLGPNTVQGGYFGDALNGTTYSDTNGNGTVTLATIGSGPTATPFYQALVNSTNLSQGLGVFSQTANSGPFVQGDMNQLTWGTPIPSAPFGPASGNIRIRWTFSLTAGDSMTTQGFFQVERAPEPATVALVGIALAGLVALRRRA